MSELLRRLNVLAECRALRWGLWQCPPFLFLVIGMVTIIAMIATYFLATRYTEEPEIAALIVILVTALLLVLGNLLINGFNRVAEANRMKSEFISIVSHQLRSPLSIFKWTLDVVEREVKSGKDSKALENFLDTLRASTENMIRLVNSLLEVSRIEARTFVLKREPFSLSELTQNIIGGFRGYAQASNISLSFRAQEPIPEIIGDPERIAMALQNFIDNAVRYTSGSGDISITVEVEDETVRWAIKDPGIGIPAAQQKNIFKKFFRAGNATRHQTRGTGIGLYVAKAIVEASGGEIGFSSEEGRGSTFWFTLPIKGSA